MVFPISLFLSWNNVIFLYNNKWHKKPSLSIRHSFGFSFADTSNIYYLMLTLRQDTCKYSHAPKHIDLWAILLGLLGKKKTAPIQASLFLNHHVQPFNVQPYISQFRLHMSNILPHDPQLIKAIA